MTRRIVEFIPEVILGLVLVLVLLLVPLLAQNIHPTIPSKDTYKKIEMKITSDPVKVFDDRTSDCAPKARRECQLLLTYPDPSKVDTYDANLEAAGWQKPLPIGTPFGLTELLQFVKAVDGQKFCVELSTSAPSEFDPAPPLEVSIRTNSCINI